MKDITYATTYIDEPTRQAVQVACLIAGESRASLIRQAIARELRFRRENGGKEYLVLEEAWYKMQKPAAEE